MVPDSKLANRFDSRSYISSRGFSANLERKKEAGDQWRPIRFYRDSEGVTDRYRNQQAALRFFDDFGWTEYMARPAVIRFDKLLDNESGYQEYDHYAMGFDRVPDYSFVRLGAHPQAFRNQDAVMLVLLASAPTDAMYRWGRKNGCVVAVCSKESAIHNNGRDYMILFMRPSVYRRYRDVLAGYLVPELSRDLPAD